MAGGAAQAVAAAEGADWDAYLAGRDPAARERLALAYLPFARILAAKLYARRSLPDAEFDDYLQLAREGMLEALARYDPSRGAKFETYAALRIEGAILNGIGAYSEVREQVALRQRLLHKRLAALQEDKPAAPDVFADLAELAVGLALGYLLDGSGLLLEEAAEAPDNSYVRLELRQMQRSLRSAVAALPERQRSVIAGHYLQQQAFEDIAQQLGLTRGRVSQLHKEALARLGAALGPGRSLDWSC